MSATVIIPTTGSPELIDAVDSVLSQTYNTKCYVVVDGRQNYNKVNQLLTNRESGNIQVAYLPENVGANGFYGHRVYAAFTHLVNSKYVLYLDQDNYMDVNHVANCVKTIEEQNLDWCYSLRSIHDKDGIFLVNDNCESLGKWPVFSGDYNHIDTNCYCLKTSIAVKIASVWHGGWGQDRTFFSILQGAFRNYDTTGKYSLNYRVGGNEGSVKKEFFEYGNKIMNEKYNGVFPWQKI
jgi:glycosyltransferase involved in cell wall biosynthesis